jgi:hypothetical protein
MSNEKLLTCPFCSGAGRLIKVMQHVRVRCDLCSSEHCGADNEADAIAGWNTRHEPKREFVVNQTEGGE